MTERREKPYVYAHRLHPTDKPFYVGLGTGNDAWEFDDRPDWWKKERGNRYVHVEVIASGLSPGRAKTLLRFHRQKMREVTN